MKRSVVTILIIAALFYAGNASAADKVVVIPLNSCNDSNLLPENIVWGVTICGVTGSTPVTVTSAGQIWMDRNLGASQVAASETDVLAYGDLYQWGRGADGHESRTSPTTTDLSTTDDPGHGAFILANSSPFDWRTPQNDALWQGVSGINNPCPPGFRLPTEVELQAEIDSWGAGNNNAAGAFASPLKLVVAGARHWSDGNVILEGRYWSSTWVAKSNGVDHHSINMYLGDSGASMSLDGRVFGHSVRCLKD